MAPSDPADTPAPAPDDVTDEAPASQADAGPEPAWLKVIHGLDRGLAKVETGGLLVGLGALIVVGVLMAVMKSRVNELTKLVTYLVFFIGMFGGALAAQGDRLINIDMLTRLFGPRGKLVLRIVTGLFTAFVCWHIFRASLRLQVIIASEYVSTLATDKGAHPLVPPTVAAWVLPISITLLGLHCLLHVVSDALHLATRRVPASLLNEAPKA